MSIFYDPSSKKWNVTYEKTDHKTDLATNNTTNYKTDYNEQETKPVIRFRIVTKYRTEYYTEYENYTSYETKYVYENGRFVSKTEPVQRQRPVTRSRQVPYQETETYTVQVPNYEAQAYARYMNQYNRNLNSQNDSINKENARENQKNTELNTLNTKKNTVYDKTVAAAGSTRGSDYIAQRDPLLAQVESLGLDKTFKDNINQNFRNFYTTEKLETWDGAKLGAKPLYGDFNPSYYKEQNPVAAQEWAKAKAVDDVDVVDRYGENQYYLWHYTTQGKPAGKRGNPAEIAEQAKAYVETKPTDQDIQNVRDLQLGINTATQAQRLLNIPEIAAEWEKAKADDPYWRRLAKNNFLDPNKADEFVTLFRISERPEDKQVSLNYNINAGYGITDLEDALNEAVGEKATVDVKRFGALTQDVLKSTIAEMKKAKSREQTLGLLGGFAGFKEIININKELTNAILGDTGVGGVLSFSSAGKAEESLEKSLQNITGVRNNATYNWQQWFDNQLKTRYQKELELGYTDKEAEQKVKIEADFARQFIDKYLIPRFNTARSMDEFVEYLDIRQEEQNPFQTQDLVNAVSLVANLRANQYLDKIRTLGDRYFDSEFYFNPSGNKARESNYLTQAETVAKDWDAAKKGDPYWAQQAYRFGININDKDAFARIHFQVKGQGQGFDAAKDILTAGGVQDEIYNNILPALKEEALKQGSVFGQFVTPEEFADEMLRGLNPNDKTTWQEVLQRYGLTDFKGTIEELKQYVIETLRTGSAQEIREEIKYLNEKRQRPTQQVLGLTYIERPEDYKDQMATPQTELYKVFQGSGYQGTEDEFYEKFFPDLDRSEQTLLTKAGSDKALKTYGLDLSDPFASLGTIESFMDEEKDSKDTTGDKSSSFFRLGLGEDEEETKYKTKTGTQILGEFTSMFKGL